MYIRDLPGQEGLASQSHLRTGTTCSARQGKGQPDRAYLAIRLRDGGRDDFRVYASETVTTRPGSVPQLISELTVTDRGWDKGGGR